MSNPFGGGILKRIQEMQERMTQVQEDLRSIRVEGSAAGGLVIATMNGQKELVHLKIEPDALSDKDTEMLEDLVVAAVTSASKAAGEAAREKLSEVTGGMLPPGMDLSSLMGQM